MFEPGICKIIGFCLHICSQFSYDLMFSLSSGYCDSSSDEVTEVDFAGIHGSVKLYTTPEVHLSDITVFTEHSYTKATVKFITEVGVTSDVKSNDIIMRYELLDRKGRVVGSVGGQKMFTGEMTVFFPTLWCPIGMSDTPGYLYRLKVSSSIVGSSILW